MVSKRGTVINKGEAFGALLTDLSRVFDCHNHEFLITKVNAYGFTLPVSKLVLDYLSDRKRRTRINNSYSK